MSWDGETSSVAYSAGLAREHPEIGGFLQGLSTASAPTNPTVVASLTRAGAQATGSNGRKATLAYDARSGLQAVAIRRHGRPVMP